MEIKMKLEFDYIRKNKALIFLKKEYTKLVMAGKYGQGMEILYNKIVQLNDEIKKIDMSIPMRTYPNGNYNRKISLWP